MLQELLKAFALIFIAEMGDKTQILAMAFATRFPVKKVLLGIFLGAFLNHGLAVLLGSVLTNFIPISLIQIIAGIAFIGFALWTLKTEEEGEEKSSQKNKYGPVLTVSLAFFLGELGDKTQLTAITLAADASYPVFILAGTVLGMIVTGALGIWIGKKLGDNVPELFIKLIAASVFLFFGVLKLFQSIPSAYLSIYTLLPFFLLLSSLVFFMVKKLLFVHQKGSKYKKTAEILHLYYQHMESDLEALCLGEENCNICKGKGCIVGYAKQVVSDALQGTSTKEPFHSSEDSFSKSFSKEDLIDALSDTLLLLQKEKDTSSHVDMVRKQLELALFHRFVEKITDWDLYFDEWKKRDPYITASLLSRIEQIKK